VSGSSSAVLRGELGLLGLFDVCELLRMNRATGTLAITSDGRRGSLHFDTGKIVNGIDELRQEGKDAACRVFGWATGSFEFHAEAVVASRLIADPTEGLMLEAARRLDEAAGSAGHPALDQLRARHGSLETLREAFRSLTDETPDTASLLDSGTEALLDLVREADDRLVLRAGQVPRVRIAGRWSAAEPTPMSADAHAALWRRLTGDTPGDRGAPRVTLADGRVFAIDAVGENGDTAIWVRRVALPPPDPGALEGPVERLVELLETRSALVLVAASTADSAERMMHALVATAAHRRSGSMLIVGDRSPYRHPHDAGLGQVTTVPTDDAARALQALRPDLVAVEPGELLDAQAFAGICLTPVALHAVVAPDLGSTMGRWRSALGAVGKDRLDALLDAVPTSVVRVASEAPDGPLGFALHLLPRASAMRSSAGASLRLERF
jgi:Domain of unknown function (DUF4388)